MQHEKLKKLNLQPHAERKSQQMKNKQGIQFYNFCLVCFQL